MAMKNLLGGYTFIDLRNVETKTSHTIAGLYGEVKKKIAETDKPLMIHNFTYNGEKINDTMITNVEEGESSAIVLTIGTSYKLTISSDSAFVAEAFTAGGGGGTSDYTQLTNLPKINGVTVTGNKTSIGYKIYGSTIALAIGEYSTLDGKTVYTFDVDMYERIIMRITENKEINMPFLFQNLVRYDGVSSYNSVSDVMVIPGQDIINNGFEFKAYDLVTETKYNAKMSFNNASHTITVEYAEISTDNHSPIISLEDSDNTYFTITPLQPEASLEYSVGTTEYNFVSFAKVSGGISVQDAQAAVTWTGSSFGLMIPINPVNALLTYGSWYLVEIPSDDPSYTNKKFWVRADYDLTNGIKIVIKMKEYT